MKIRQLEYFCAVAEEKSISAAARELHVAQPPISRQIAQLEEELGVQLFLRGSKDNAATLPAAEPVLNGRRRDAADRLRAESRRPARNGAGCGRDFRLCKADSVLLLRLRGRNVCRRRPGRVIGLENDDDDRRDDLNQSGRGVEGEAFAEVDDADQYGRQGCHRAEERSHRRADMLDRQHQRQV